MTPDEELDDLRRQKYVWEVAFARMVAKQASLVGLVNAAIGVIMGARDRVPLADPTSAEGHQLYHNLEAAASELNEALKRLEERD